MQTSNDLARKKQLYQKRSITWQSLLSGRENLQLVVTMA
jgi:hypothetical protein